MEGPRAPLETELPLILDFLNHKLRPNSSWSIATEYPTALTRSNIHNMRIITDGGGVLSHAVLKPLIVRTPHVVLKVGAIGSVVTEEGHRGQGLSTQIIESCLQEARTQSCDIAVLWTEIHDFYRKMGFELAGFEESFVIEKPLQVERVLNCKTTAQVSPEAILRLYQKHTVQTHRTLEDVRKFLQIPNSRIYTAWDPATNTLEAFAVEGKGADLTDYLHEWSGSVPALFALFNYILAEKRKPFVLITPRHAVQLIKSLNAQSFFHHEGFLGMIKILDRQQLLTKVDKAFKTLGMPGPELKNLGDTELIRLLFGPWNELSPLNLNETARSLDVLPLRFWLWGWDSI